MKLKYKIMGATAAALFATGACVTSCCFFPDKPSEVEYNGTTSVTIDSIKYKFVWEDDFDGDSLDTSEFGWNFEVVAAGKANNSEVQAYTKTQTVVSDGTLKIIANKSGSTWNSARITTQGKRDFMYGYFEARIKMPRAFSSTTTSTSTAVNGKKETEFLEDNGGVWPAFWLMPTDSVYGGWPCSGELDIMEYSPGTSAQKVYATVHYGTDATAGHKYTSIGGKNITAPEFDSDDDWHTYGLLWTSGTVEAFYDGKSLGAVYANPGKKWQKYPYYDQKFYIILNLAMGGTLGGGINSDMRSAIYEIDYVRVYQ